MNELRHATPLWQTVTLAVGFVALTVIGIATVLWPEIADTPPEQDAAQEHTPAPEVAHPES